MNKPRKSTSAMALLLVLVFASVPAALGFEAEGHRLGGDLAASISYSGDDAYDPAAGGAPELSVSAPAQRAFMTAASLSGDDTYDPAAGGTPELSVSAPAQRAFLTGASFSGDDAYDPAAGGTPELSVSAPDTEDEIEARGAWSV